MSWGSEMRRLLPLIFAPLLMASDCKTHESMTNPDGGAVATTCAAEARILDDRGEDITEGRVEVPVGGAVSYHVDVARFAGEPATIMWTFSGTDIVPLEGEFTDTVTIQTADATPGTYYLEAFVMTCGTMTDVGAAYLDLVGGAAR